MSSSSLKQAKTKALDIPALCNGFIIIAISLEDSQRVLRGHGDEGKVDEVSLTVN